MKTNWSVDIKIAKLACFMVFASAIFFFSNIEKTQAATLTFVGSNSAIGTGTSYPVSLTALTGGISGSAAAGDIVVVTTGWTSTADGAPGVVTSGYAELANLYSSDTRDANMSVDWKIMPATPDTSVMVKGFGNAANGGATVVQVWRGVDQGTPIDVTTTTTSANNQSAARPDAPNIAPVTAGVMILACGLGTGDTTPQTFTAPAGMSNGVSRGGNGTTYGAIASMASYAYAGIAYNPAAWTGGETVATDSWAAASVALRPANDPPTLTVTAPASDSEVNEGSNATVNYTLSDPDSAATVSFYYETDGNGAGGTAISTCATQAESGAGSCSFNPLTIGSPMSLSTYYYIYGVATDGVNANVTVVSAGRVRVNDAPVLSVSQPDGTSDTIAEGANFSVTYSLADAEEVVTAAFFWDTNNSGYDGTAITGTCATAAEGAGVACSWDTTGVSPGSYYIYGKVSDGKNAEVKVYSSGTMTVNDRPTLSVSQPDGVGDSVTAGDAYDITYSLADNDDVVTAAFYWDTNNSGYDGTAITGTCATAAEGAGVACSWDTTGMSAGTYYVYATVSDVYNPSVSAYSPGVITVASGSLTFDIVTSGGSSVSSPSVSFSSGNFSWGTQQSAGALGASEQRLRVTNTRSTRNWSLTIAATLGNTTLWDGGSYNYDFNGTSSAGRLYVDPQVGTVAPQGGCNTMGLSKGTAYYFEQGTRDSITVLSADGSAGNNCYWDFTGMSLTQDIPASQNVGSYSIGMTLTAT